MSKKAKIGYYKGKGSSCGIAIEYDGCGFRITDEKIWGFYQPIAEFNISRHSLGRTIKELQAIYEIENWR